ncbi:hypothetical protein ACRDNQ_16140 [Palleronia sp. KMU-117]|uniref:hypothetical protein n=1 Tax=Palleronia sp. KMU-117 TaxID=3434108 RepID=UPI003D7531D1
MNDAPAALSPTAAALCDRYLAARDRAAEAALLEMESRLPPADYLTALACLADARPEARAALEGRRAAERLAGMALQPFRLTEDAADHSHYAAPGPSRGRTHLTVFAGAASRPGTWTPVFLQALDARRVEVLILRDRTGRHFRAGCPGLADGLPELVAAVGARVRAGGYARHVAMGVSRGGGAALGFGRLAGCERAIAFGALPRSDPLRLLAGQPMPPAFDPLCECLSHLAAPLCAVFAEGNAPDAAHAAMLTALYGGTRLKVPDLSDHGVVHHVSAIGRLPELMRAVLDDPLPPGPGARPREVTFGVPEPRGWRQWLARQVSGTR